VTLYRRIQRTLRKRGVLGTVRKALVELPDLIRKLQPSSLRARAAERSAERAVEDAFDRTYGVDTSGIVHPSAMHDVESENLIYGIRYKAIRPDLFEESIGALDIEPHRYSFVDYGSGKGRVLLLASRLPFRRVIGVEYSPTLHQIAEQNLHSVQFAERRSGPVESVCMDAVRFPIPEEPVVLYFYDPFDRPIMESVRDNVVRSYEGNPRSIVVVYAYPRHSDVWDAVEFLRRHASSNVKDRDYVIYKDTRS
jgi:SAM-dependent methyltransferase